MTDVVLKCRACKTSINTKEEGCMILANGVSVHIRCWQKDSDIDARDVSDIPEIHVSNKHTCVICKKELAETIRDCMIYAATHCTHGWVHNACADVFLQPSHNDKCPICMPHPDRVAEILPLSVVSNNMNQRSILCEDVENAANMARKYGPYKIPNFDSPAKYIAHELQFKREVDSQSKLTLLLEHLDNSLKKKTLDELCRELGVTEQMKTENK